MIALAESERAAVQRIAAELRLGAAVFEEERPVSGRQHLRVLAPRQSRIQAVALDADRNRAQLRAAVAPDVPREGGSRHRARVALGGDVYRPTRDVADRVQCFADEDHRAVSVYEHNGTLTAVGVAHKPPGEASIPAAVREADRAAFYLDGGSQTHRSTVRRSEHLARELGREERAACPAPCLLQADHESAEVFGGRPT